MEFQGKVALVTGSSSGIGRAIAIDLAKQNVSVVINYSKSKEEAYETAKEVEKVGSNALVYQASVKRDEEVHEMVNKTINYFGRIDFLINCAGTTTFVSHNNLEGLEEKHWDQVMDVNVKGLFYTSRAASKELKKNKGCIINITSIAGLNGTGSSIAYAASKAAAISVTKSLARVLAPEVRVNSVAPGAVITKRMKGKENFVKEYTKNTPLEKVAKPENVSQVVLSLIGAADFVTGQTIVVDGGYLLN